MIISSKIVAGASWTLAQLSGYMSWYDPWSFCVTPTGRIIAGSRTDFGTGGIWYSDDNGVNWTQSTVTSDWWNSFCVTSTGRIIAGSGSGIWYSDDNGVNWIQSNKTDNSWYAFCVTQTGRIITIAYDTSIWYSDDSGVNWTQSNYSTDNPWGESNCALCVTSTGRIIAAIDRNLYYSDDNGVNWTEVMAANVTNKLGQRWADTGGSMGWRALCVTSTGRIIAGGAAVTATFKGIWYSDDNGVNWIQSNKTDADWSSFCVTPTGRIIAGSKNTMIIDNNYDGGGIWYSDDNGINWIQSNKTDDWWYSFCITSTGRIIASRSDDIWYSDPVPVPIKLAREKYLDQNGAQEIVTQFKSYCNSLVGGE